MASKAFVDTTVLVDRLLKPGQRADIARRALARYDVTLLPVYAIKEFRTGALKNYKWAHNKLVEKGNISDFLLAANANRRSVNLAFTGLEALSAGLSLIPGSTINAWRKKYGDEAEPSKMHFDAVVANIRSLIYRAWARRRSITDEIVDELPCFQEKGPYQKREFIELDKPLRPCGNQPNCAIEKILLRNVAAVSAVRNANDKLPNTAEKLRRHRGLRHLTRSGQGPLPEDYCRGLGDAVFALTAPNNCVVLTTNAADHEPLAGALGKKVETP